jgi:hypothetical protein
VGKHNYLPIIRSNLQYAGIGFGGVPQVPLRFIVSRKNG